MSRKPGIRVQEGQGREEPEFRKGKKEKQEGRAGSKYQVERARR
jgi:hypothetical protein